MLTVIVPLELWTGGRGSWHFLTIPDGQSDEIRFHALETPRGFRSVRVEARIGAVRWRTSVFPVESGGYFLPVKAEVRRKAAIAVGDRVTVSLELL